MDKLFVSSTGWQIFQWALGMMQHQSWPQSLGDISMPAVGTDHAISHNTGENRCGQLHAELIYRVPQFDATISVDRQSAGT